MENEKRQSERQNSDNLAVAVALAFLLSTILLFSLSASTVTADASGPSFTILSNSSRSTTQGTQINTSGGYIYTVAMNATQQNQRWKAFVGNISGKLTLDDVSANTVFDWNTTSTTGQVYATRSGAAVTWSNVSCANSTEIANEDISMALTNGADNITRTFSQQNHTPFYVGTRTINNNTCYSIHTYVNDASQYISFQEMVMKDKGGAAFLFTTTIEVDATGYNGNNFDFQMIVPENGTAGWSSQTPYYFFVELI